MEHRGIPFHTAHMGIKGSGIMIVRIAATEELLKASGSAVIADDFQGFPAGIGFIQVIPFRCQIDLQRIDDIRLVITNQNIVHGMGPPTLSIP